MAFSWTNTAAAKGKILAALVAEIQNAIKQIATDLYATPINVGTGAGALTSPVGKSSRAGSSTTNGTAGREITFASAEPDINYTPVVTFLADPGGDTGAVRVARTTTGMTVYTAGPTTGIAFAWAIIRHSDPA
jgi:hypothetical protein